MASCPLVCPHRLETVASAILVARGLLMRVVSIVLLILACALASAVTFAQTDPDTPSGVSFRGGVDDSTRTSFVEGQWDTPPQGVEVWIKFTFGPSIRFGTRTMQDVLEEAGCSGTASSFRITNSCVREFAIRESVQSSDQSYSRRIGMTRYFWQNFRAGESTTIALTYKRNLASRNQLPRRESLGSVTQRVQIPPFPPLPTRTPKPTATPDPEYWATERARVSEWATARAERMSTAPVPTWTQTWDRMATPKPTATPTPTATPVPTLVPLTLASDLFAQHPELEKIWYWHDSLKAWMTVNAMYGHLHPGRPYFFRVAESTWINGHRMTCADAAYIPKSERCLNVVVW